MGADHEKPAINILTMGKKYVKIYIVNNYFSDLKLSCFTAFQLYSIIKN